MRVDARFNHPQFRSFLPMEIVSYSKNQPNFASSTIRQK